MKISSLIVLMLMAPMGLGARSKPPAKYLIPLPPKADFSSLEWMLGEWEGQTLKQSPPAKIHLSVSGGLDQQVMIFREEISFSATQNTPASKEISLGILTENISDESFLFQVFSSTGFITRYRVTVAGPEIDFTSVGGVRPPPGWLSRRVIERTDSAAFTETEQLAPPRHPFFDRYTAKFIRVTAPKSPQPAHLHKGEKNGPKMGVK